MKEFNLSQLKWTVSGYTPLEWEMGLSKEVGSKSKIEVFPVPAQVPGSVQKALLDAA